MNIIFIDDDEDLNFLHRRMCARSKLIRNYFIATGAPETLEYLASTSKRPDIIFVDLNMPEMDGFQFIEEFERTFSSKYPDTQLYVLTSSVRRDDRKKSMEYGAVKGFLEKPLMEPELEKICYQQVTSG